MKTQKAPSHVSFNRAVDIHPVGNGASTDSAPSSPVSAVPPLILTLINKPDSGDYDESDSARISFSNSSMRSSIRNDLEDVLELDSPQYKGVNFMPHSPTKLHYPVSHDGRESTMKSVGPLFPIEELVESQSQQEILSKSNSLREAAAKATIKMEDDEKGDGASSGSSKKKGKQSKSEKKKKKKKKKTRHKSKAAATPRTGKLIKLYIEIGTKSKIKFDMISVTKTNHKTVLLSSKRLESGKTHQWSIEILKCDVELQVES